MNLPKYNLKASPNYVSFRFVSEGQKGKITKEIIFSPIEDTLIWNLGFGDLDTTSGIMSDSIVSNNGDRDKILATVAFAALIFSEHHPSALIYVEGSTPSRTRLYRIGISNYFEDISETFDIWGLFNDEWQSFQKNTVYDAFLVKRK